MRIAREARAAFGPPPPDAVEPAVPPARMHVTDGSAAAGLPPTPASATVPDAPPGALYWKVVKSGEIAESTSVGEGDNSDVTLLLDCKDSGTGGIAPMTEVSKRSDVENVTRETFGAWVADVPLPPPEALYWKIVSSSNIFSGQVAKSLSVGDGEDGNVSLLLHTVRIYSAAGGSQQVVFKRPDVENVTRETYGAWVADVYGAGIPSPAKTPEDDTVADDGDGGSVHSNDDRNDSAPAAFAKVLTYQTMMEQTGMGNAELRATTLRVRECSPCHVSAPPVS